MKQFLRACCSAVLCAGVLANCGSPQSQNSEGQSSHSDSRAVEQLPNFQGRYSTDPFSMHIPTPAILTASGQKWVDDFTPDKDPALQCPEVGTPHFLYGPGDIDVSYLEGGDIQISKETFFMDGREFPDEIELTKPGYSIGRWEGEKLIVETRGLLSGDILSPYNATMKPSDALTMKRAYYLVEQGQRWAALGLASEEINPLQKSDGRTLQIDVWLTDPNVFAQTWHTIKQYRELSTEILDEDLLLEWKPEDAGLPADFVNSYDGDCVLFPEYEEE